MMLRKPDVLRMENHTKPTLKKMMNYTRRATHLDTYLKNGIVAKKDEESWLEERSRTVMDEKNKRTHFRRYDEDGNRLPPEPIKNLPKEGSLMEKQFAHDIKAPFTYRRNKQWTKYTFGHKRAQEEWDDLEKKA